MDTVMIALVVALIFIATAADALRDAWMRSEDWWTRHLVKWISFYLPLTYITVTDLPKELWLPVSVAAWLVWRLSLRYIGGVQWESMWVRWTKKALGWDK